MSSSTRLILFLTLSIPALAAEPAGTAPAANPVTPPTTAATTDPTYCLTAGDTVMITIYNEPDLAVSQVIGHSGEVRLVLVGDITIGGMTIRDAQRTVEAAYRDKQFLKDPMISIAVTAYNPREVSVLGAVRAPGPLTFPRDTTSLDIVEVITRVGGFLPVAKSDAVTITHKRADGTESVITCDLEDMVSGRRQPGKDRANILVYPGDRVWVPERLF
jgi:polysaccharide export outer membrane protein